MTVAVTPGPEWRLARDRSGSVLVEFSLLAPVWIALLVFMLDFSEAFYLKMKIATALNGAAQYAFLNAQWVTPSTVTSFLANVQTVGQTTANLDTAPTVTVLFNNAAGTANSANYYCVSGGSSLTYISTGTSSASCGGAVMSGRYITITVAGQMSTFFPADPILGATIQVSDTAIVRFQ